MAQELHTGLEQQLEKEQEETKEDRPRSKVLGMSWTKAADLRCFVWITEDTLLNARRDY